MKCKHLILLYLGIFSCTSHYEPVKNITLSWTSYRNGQFDSDGIHLYSGKNSKIPLKAFRTVLNKVESVTEAFHFICAISYYIKSQNLSII